MSAVLVVDDSLTVRMDLLEAFEAGGLSTVSCANAAEARAAMSQERFQLIVLDVLLPDADGVELLAEIRRSPDGDTAVMMLSTEAEVRDRVRGLCTGADEYVGKPYERSYVVSRALEILRLRTPRTSTRKTILVIDDSATFREELRTALEAADYQVALASSGEEGLRVAADLLPAAVIVDGVLPGLDGASVIRRLRLDAVLRRTPCVLLTAAEEVGAELKALEAGADAFVRKEDDVAVVLARLGAVLRSAPGAAEECGAASLSGPKKILAVDDSPTYLHELSEVLRADGYDVVLARTGDEALELLAVQPVDCILLDLLMPGLSGRDTCMRIKDSTGLREVPLIMLTALEEREAMIAGLAAGADDYITKSADFEVLRARVRAQIRRRQFEDENRRVREQLLGMELEAAEARSARQLADARAALLEELERKNAELEAFSYSVSHDLRAPLRAIAGFARILAAAHGPALDDEGRRVIRVISESAAKMWRLIDDLLSFSRMGRKAFRDQPIDMTALVRAVVDDLRPTWAGREVRILVPDLPPARGDKAMLRQVWINYLSNAVKYSRTRAVATIEVLGHAQGTEVAYCVRDDGVGFDMKYAGKLFGVFQRLHADDQFEGTGIGLALVKRIVSRHGGRVWAEGRVGQGAEFWFSLPLDERGAKE